METMRLGRTELQVTKLGMGGIQLAKISDSEAAEVLGTGLDGGINFVETARGYWDSELKLGQAIRRRRDQVIIATKASATDAAQMTARIDESLTALNTDYIDLYQFHGCDRREQYEQMIASEGALDALIRAKKAGKIRAIGFSSHQLTTAMEFMDNEVFTSAQLPISFMNTENHEEGLFEKAQTLDTGLIAMKPFGGGRLGTARLCMGYAMPLPNVAVVVGVDTVEHVRELLELAHDPPQLTHADHAEMDRIRNDLGTRFCRACNYCQPCPQDIPIYQNLWLPVYVAQMGPERTLTRDRVAMIRKSADCTECRQCEERCPFGLKIVDGLAHCRKLVEHLIAEHGGPY